MSANQGFRDHDARHSEGNFSVRTGRRYKKGQGLGSDFTFVVIADQYPPFTIRVFVADRALAAWREAHGRDLDSTEQYAAAKMRLFQAFDEHERLREQQLGLIVDETNVEGLLAPLDLT